MSYEPGRQKKALYSSPSSTFENLAEGIQT
jgi:hypothetical protein